MFEQFLHFCCIFSCERGCLLVSVPSYFSHREAENKSALIRECLCSVVAQTEATHTPTHTAMPCLTLPSVIGPWITVCQRHIAEILHVCLSSGYWWLQRLNIPSVSFSFFSTDGDLRALVRGNLIAFVICGRVQSVLEGWKKWKTVQKQIDGVTEEMLGKHIYPEQVRKKPFYWVVCSHYLQGHSHIIFLYKRRPKTDPDEIREFLTSVSPDGV